MNRQNSSISNSEKDTFSKIILILKALMFSLIIAVTIKLFVLPQYICGYEAAFLDKRQIAKDMNSPKILLMGDSNVYFGIDSKKISDEIGMPVVNLGLHGGLGQTFTMDLAKDLINEGDIVIAMPAKYDYHVGTDGVLPWLILEDHIELYPLVQYYDWWKLIKGFPQYLKRSISLWLSNSGNYNANKKTRYNHNEFGDHSYTGMTNTMENGYNGAIFLSGVNEELADYYNDYEEYCNSRGATFLLAGSPIIEPSIGSDIENVVARDKNIKNDIDVTYISNSLEYVYPIELFYDADWHLNEIGREKRSCQLIEDIKKWMNQ